MMRVLHVLNQVDVGGIETFVLEFVRHHDREAFAPAICELRRVRSRLRDEMRALPGVPLVHCAWDGPWDVTFPWRFASLCRRRKVDAVVSYSMATYGWVMFGAWLGGVRRRLVSVQNPPPFDGPATLKYRLYERWSRRFCQGEVPIARHVADSLIKAYGMPRSRVRVVPNGIDVLAVSRRASDERARFAQTRPRVTMVARLEGLKDHATLIDAFAVVRREVRDAVLTLVGDGPLREQLESQVRRLGLTEAVEFPGFRRDVPEVLGRTSVFAFSTTAHEGLGNVQVEAMAARVPVIATDVPACREALGGGRAGVLVPPGDPDALAGAILRLLKDAPARRRLVDEGYRWALEHYDIRAVVRAYERLLMGEEAHDERSG